MPIIRPFNGKYPKIAEDAFIADDAVIIGDVEIGSKSSIWYGCVIRADVNYIRIGEGTNIQDSSMIHVSRYNGPTIIGSGITVGHKVTLHACTLDDYSFVGMGAILLDRSEVKKHGMLAAGAMLTPKKIVPAGELWAGEPAKFFRAMSKEEIEYIYTSEKNYIKLSAEHKGMQ